MTTTKSRPLKRTKTRYKLFYRESGKWVRSMAAYFTSIRSAREYAGLLGARKISIRPVKRRE